jgi:NifU-like protein involved in Fe-S cluster formation
MLEWDVTGSVTCSTNMITHHIPALTAQRIIETRTQMIQCIQAPGLISAEAILCTVLSDMALMTSKVLNSIEDPGL